MLVGSGAGTGAYVPPSGDVASVITAAGAVTFASGVTRDAELDTFAEWITFTGVTGTCNTTTFVRGDGSCQATGGGGGTEGPGIDITGGVVSWDPATFVGNVSMWDAANASRTWTANLSGATDPTLTFSNDSLVVTNAATVDFSGDVFGRTFTGDDITTGAGNLSSTYDNDTNLTPDPDCNQCPAGRLCIRDIDEGATDGAVTAPRNGRPE